MKIAYITSQFPVPSETFAAGDVLELQRFGHEVHVFGYRFNHPAMSAMVAERSLQSISMENSSPVRFAGGLMLMLAQPRLAYQLVSWLVLMEIRQPETLFRSLLLSPAFFWILHRLRRIKPDIVHLFWGHYPSILGFLVQRAMPQVKLSLFLGAHDLTARMRISAFMGQRADFVFTHARANLPLLEELGIPGSRVTVVHRGIDAGALDRIISSVPRQKEHGLVLSAGRLQAFKGFDDTLRIFAALQEKHGDLRLGILGDGPEKDALMQLAEDLGIRASVRFYGHLPHQEVIRLMAASPLFLFMSRHDGERLPNSVKEAMFCRCICISTDTVGIEELIDNGKTGFIVPKADIGAAESLAEKVLCDVFASIPEAARQKIYNDFSRIKAMQQYVDAWMGKDL